MCVRLSSVTYKTVVMSEIFEREAGPNYVREINRFYSNLGNGVYLIEVKFSRYTPMQVAGTLLWINPNKCFSFYYIYRYNVKLNNSNSNGSIAY